ncbi:MAG: hypothetical protein ACRD52_16055, partial [Candidatus Acidiferrales bacterium]
YSSSHIYKYLLWEESLTEGRPPAYIFSAAHFSASPGAMDKRLSSFDFSYRFYYFRSGPSKPAFA